jgi:hypothetical protein
MSGMPDEPLLGERISQHDNAPKTGVESQTRSKRRKSLLSESGE